MRRLHEYLSPSAFAAWDRPVWAVGPATAEAARAAGLPVIAGDFGTADALAARLEAEAGAAEAGVAALPFLFLCGDRRRDVLPDRLRAAGLAVAEHVVYRAHLALERVPPQAAAPDWAVFFSPTGVEVAHAVPAFPWSARLAAIGPTTAAALEAGGHAVAAVAAAPTPDALAHALVHA